MFRLELQQRGQSYHTSCPHVYSSNDRQGSHQITGFKIIHPPFQVSFYETFLWLFSIGKNGVNVLRLVIKHFSFGTAKKVKFLKMEELVLNIGKFND